MKKILKAAALIGIVLCVVYMLGLKKDKQQLSEGVLRLHVVGASDSAEDQAVKLLVRDAVLSELKEVTESASSKNEVMSLAADRQSQVADTANRVLAEQGFTETVTVTLGAEEFPTRQYDTFSLPAGVYDTVRVTIGPGEGRNWWCVIFPGLCMGATSDDVANTAVGAGFSDSLCGAITDQPRYEIRFYLLDALGRLENFFRKG